MLLELRVKNFAVVEDAWLRFDSGMSAFTGETGAGKSLLLDAITLLLGAKAQAQLVRAGTSCAEVEGVFSLAAHTEARERAAHMGFDLEESDEQLLLVRREISAQGKSRVWIQGRAATLTQLQELLGDWVEISGQHEYLRLGRESFLLRLLDSFGGLTQEARDFATLFDAYQEAVRECELQRERESTRESRLDYLQFQIEELERAGLGALLPLQAREEEQRLEELRTRLGNVEKIRAACEQIAHFFDGSEGADSAQAGAVAQLKSAGRELRALQVYGPDFARLADLSGEALTLTEELAGQLRRLSVALEGDPEALEGAEARLSQIRRLKRKYNCESDALVQMLQNATQELRGLQAGEARLSELERLCSEREGVMLRAGQALRARREKAAHALNKGWQKEIRQLGMAHACLQMQVSEGAYSRENAGSRVQALFSANAGEEARPLAKVASGGELSRIMLALKSVVSGRSEVGVYLFDEVDAGIGGATALSVGERLRRIAQENQVLVVTHLPQVAAFAHTQFRIFKETRDGRTHTKVERPSAAERLAEIARMLGGSAESKTARSLAEELLAKAAASDKESPPV